MALAGPVHLDGRTGEGGGQLVRIAIALASVTCKPVKITDVRGNRPGPRGGGKYIAQQAPQTRVTPLSIIELTLITPIRPQVATLYIYRVARESNSCRRKRP